MIEDHLHIAHTGMATLVGIGPTLLMLTSQARHPCYNNYWHSRCHGYNGYSNNSTLNNNGTSNNISKINNKIGTPKNIGTINNIGILV